MNETLESQYLEKAIEYLAVYPLQELYDPYVKISKIITIHERPWRSVWSAQFSFVHPERGA